MVPSVPDGVVQAAQGGSEPAVPGESLSPSATKETTLDEVNGLDIDSVIRLLSQFAEQVNNQSLHFVAVKERHKNGTDKCNHCSKRGKGLFGRVRRVAFGYPFKVFLVVGVVFAERNVCGNSITVVSHKILGSHPSKGVIKESVSHGSQSSADRVNVAVASLLFLKNAPSPEGVLEVVHLICISTFPPGSSARTMLDAVELPES